MFGTNRPPLVSAAHVVFVRNTSEQQTAFWVKCMPNTTVCDPQLAISVYKSTIMQPEYT